MMNKLSSFPSNRYIEPGLVSLLQIFLGFQWLLMVLAFCNLSNNGDPGDPLNIVLALLYTSLLLLYLRSDRLKHWLRQAYLPLALLIASFTPIFIRALAVQMRLDAGIVGSASVPEPGALILWLFTPLFAVAAQYGFIAVMVFCSLTTGFDLYFAAELAAQGSIPVDVHIEQAIIRNLIFLATGFIIARLIGEQRRQRHALREANQRLTRYATTLEQLAVSRERNRMARDLHDTLAHTLSAVAIQLEAVTTIWESSPAAARERIETLQSLTREGLKETRHALQALRSSPLDDMELPMALQTLATKAADRAGFTVHVDTLSTLPDLPLEIELNLYRIAEEALNNAVRHAQADEVWLTLAVNGGQITLDVRDNGTGFDPETTPADGHFGLVGMRERATLLNSTLHINSTPGSGTHIHIATGVDL
jgi:signal transduction histidine kinase